MGYKYAYLFLKKPLLDNIPFDSPTLVETSYEYNYIWCQKLGKMWNIESLAGTNISVENSEESLTNKV